MNIDPRHLGILRAVIDAGSFSAAARALNMSQPSVSVAISQLESRIGRPVVIRDRKGVQLTDEGRILLRHAIALDNVLEAAHAEIGNRNTGMVGPLKIGGTPGALLAMVPRVMAGLDIQFGDIAVSVLELTDADIPDALARRDLELVFCTEAGSDQMFEEIPLRREAFLLVSAPGVLPNTALSIADAAQFSWVLPRQEGETRRRLEAVFLNADVALPRSVVRCDLLATQKEILRQGRAVALLPQTVVEAEVAAGLLVTTTLKGGPPPRRLVARKLRAHLMSPLAEAALSIACGVGGDEL